MKGLSNEEIDGFIVSNHWMRRYYIGCFPSCHRINFPRKRRYCFITNTDNHSKTGQHWNAWFIIDKTVYFMDTFGRSPTDLSFPHNYVDIVSNFKKQYYFPFMIQPVSSFTCGYYCIHFILLLSLGLNLSDFKNEYTDKLIDNDKKVISIIKSM